MATPLPKPLPTPRNTRAQLAIVLAAAGAGLLIYGVLQWRKLPDYSEKDLAASIELNLGLDIARLGPDRAPSDAQIDIMRKAIRSEVDAEISEQRAVAQNWLAAGVALLVMGFAQMLMQRYLIRPTAAGRRP